MDANMTKDVIEELLLKENFIKKLELSIDFNKDMIKINKKRRNKSKKYYMNLIKIMTSIIVITLLLNNVPCMLLGIELLHIELLHIINAAILSLGIVGDVILFKILKIDDKRFDLETRLHEEKIYNLEQEKEERLKEYNNIIKNLEEKEKNMYSYLHKKLDEYKYMEENVSLEENNSYDILVEEYLNTEKTKEKVKKRCKK